MSALESLNRILVIDDNSRPLPELPAADSLDALQQYINQQQTQATQVPQSLEHIRVMAAASGDGDNWDQLDTVDLFKLSAKFERYQEHIGLHRHKLRPIESILNNFNTELNQLSSTLISLQQQSARLSTNSSLQKATTEKLNPIILDLIIPPDIVKSVIHDEIEARWVENIKFINEKIQLLAAINNNPESLTAEYKDTKAAQQLETGIKLLTDKAVERIRDFIIAQIKLLRAPGKISSQVIQQKLLLVKEIFVFLRTHHPKLADQLKLAYIHTMRWYYQTRFAKYIYALSNLNIRHVDLSLVLGGGSEDKGVFGLKGWLGTGVYPTHHSPSPASNQVSLTEYLTSIDKRIEVLQHPSTPTSAIPSQIAETTPFAYWLEFIYHQWSIALVDNIVVEYLFVVDFFYLGDEKFEDFETLRSQSQQAPETRNNKDEWPKVMFQDVFKLGREFVNWLIMLTPATHVKNTSSVARVTTSAGHGSCDAYAILLMIRLTQNSQSLLHNEFHIPILDDYLNGVLMSLWPHFLKIIDLNCESLKKTIIRTSKESSLAPVGVTQQYAQFLLGLLKLMNVVDENEFKGEPLFNSFNRLRGDFETLLTKLSNHFFGSGKSKATEKEIFLYNNYFLIVSILKNENFGEKSSLYINEQIKHFEMLCDAYSKH